MEVKCEQVLLETEHMSKGHKHNNNKFPNKLLKLLQAEVGGCRDMSILAMRMEEIGGALEAKHWSNIMKTMEERNELINAASNKLEQSIYSDTGQQDQACKTHSDIAINHQPTGKEVKDSGTESRAQSD